MALLDLSEELHELVVAEVANLRAEVMLAVMQAIAERPMPPISVGQPYTTVPVTVQPADVHVQGAEVNVDVDVMALGTVIGDRVAEVLVQPMEAMRRQLAAVEALLNQTVTKTVHRDGNDLIETVTETRR